MDISKQLFLSYFFKVAELSKYTYKGPSNKSPLVQEAFLKSMSPLKMLLKNISSLITMAMFAYDFSTFPV
jgi:hypothetical protein